MNNASNQDAPLPLTGHSLAFAARGFVRTLTDEQMAAFISLFSGGCHAARALEAAVEQAVFERGRTPKDVPSPMLMSALDYALPRQSAAGSIVADEIRKRWKGLTDATRSAIRDRINRAVIEGQAGSRIDEKLWLEIARMPVSDAEEADRRSF